MADNVEKLRRLLQRERDLIKGCQIDAIMALEPKKRALVERVLGNGAETDELRKVAQMMLENVALLQKYASVLRGDPSA